MSKQLWDAIEKMDVNGAKSIINSIPPEELNKSVYGMQDRTVLQRAVSKGLIEVVQLIIEKNPDTLQYECSYGRLKGYSLLRFAVPSNAKEKTGGTEIAKLLFNHPQYNSKAKAILADKVASQEILELVIRQGLSDLCKWYFDKVPAITTMVDKLGQTPLHWAIQSDDIEIVKFFLDKMSDDEFNNFTVSLHPLRFSTCGRREEITKLLLGKTSLEKLKSVDEYGGILHCAAKRGLTKFIDDILPKFSPEEIIAIDKHGHTPLFYAYERDIVSYASNTLLPITAKAYEYILSKKGLTYDKLHPQLEYEKNPDIIERNALCNFAKENGCNNLYMQLLSNQTIEQAIEKYLLNRTTEQLIETLKTLISQEQFVLLNEIISPKLFGQVKPNDDVSISKKANEQTEYLKLKEEFEEYKKQAEGDKAELKRQIDDVNIDDNEAANTISGMLEINSTLKQEISSLEQQLEFVKAESRHGDNPMLLGHTNFHEDLSVHQVGSLSNDTDLSHV
jgi:ankyrin repeat protein